MQKLKKELLRFLVAGCMAVGTDFSTYWLMSNYIQLDIAKGASFILGSVVAFFINKLWTFESDSKTSVAIVQFSLLYTFTFLANVGVNHLVLLFVPELKLAAFLAATATSTILNFLGMKFWVFKASMQ